MVGALQYCLKRLEAGQSWKWSGAVGARGRATQDAAELGAMSVSVPGYWSCSLAVLEAVKLVDSVVRREKVSFRTKSSWTTMSASRAVADDCTGSDSVVVVAGA